MSHNCRVFCWDQMEQQYPYYRVNTQQFVYHSPIWICEMYMECSYIYNIEQRISKHEKHLRLLSSGTKLFITFVFKGSSTWGERGTIFLCRLFHLPTPSASKRKPTVLVWSLVSTPLTFFKFQKSFARFRCVTSFALCNPVSHLGLLWHLWLTRPLRARAWTPVVMLHLSNPCTEPKGPQAN